MRAISNSRASGEAIIGDVPNAELRSDLLPFAVGVLLLTVGIVAAAAGLLRHRSRATVLYFGGACALYGLRLAADTQPAQLLIHAPPSFWLRLIASVTYLITVPVAFFFAHFLGGRWQRVFRWVAVVNGMYAAGAIAFEALAGPGTAMRPYVYLMLGNQGLGIWALTRPDFPVNRELRAVQVAYLILVIFILNENADDFGLPSMPNVEWIGFTIFLAGLGWATALRVFEGERRLAAMTQEMETARRIQTSILPRTLPRIPGVSLAVRYQPMNAVAGDLYDIVACDSGLGVFVADVSGHGVPAALVASMVKVAFAAQAPHAEDPSRVLAEINRTLCGSLDGAYVTAAYAWVDLRSSRLAYAAAGHPPLLVRGSRGVELLAENGLMMGVMSDAEYPSTSRALARGDRLVLYTDGAIEAFNPGGEAFELERLIDLLETSRDAPDHFADAVLARLAAWRGGRGATDDLTLLVLDVEA
jgi:sigma-B regulation protein RsbU (phosphoserine phosphatase)